VTVRLDEAASVGSKLLLLQTEATCASSDNWLSRMTPRSRAVLTTVTLADNSGTSLMFILSNCWLEPSHMTWVFDEFSRSRLAVIQSLTSATQAERRSTAVAASLAGELRQDLLVEFVYSTWDARYRIIMTIFSPLSSSIPFPPFHPAPPLSKEVNKKVKVKVWTLVTAPLT